MASPRQEALPPSTGKACKGPREGSGNMGLQTDSRSRLGWPVLDETESEAEAEASRVMRRLACKWHGLASRVSMNNEQSATGIVDARDAMMVWRYDGNATRPN